MLAVGAALWTVAEGYTAPGSAPGTRGEAPGLFDPAVPPGIEASPANAEGVGTQATRLVVEIAPFELIDDDTASASIPTPDFHALGQRLQLVRIKTTRELHAELLEEL
jgi:hypothetical protein